MQKPNHPAVEFPSSARKTNYQSLFRGSVSDHQGRRTEASRDQQDRPAHTILLVSNDDDLRPMIRAYLEHLGFAVISCTDARRAHEIACGDHEVHLLLLDLSSLEANSLAVVLEWAEFRRAMPAVIIAGARLTVDAIKIIEDREWKVLRKPLRLPEVLATIQRAFDRQQIHAASCPATDIRSTPRVLPFRARNANRAAWRPGAPMPNRLTLILPKPGGDIPTP